MHSLINLVLLLTISSLTLSSPIRNERKTIFLDADKKYLLAWIVNEETQTIEFEMEVETTGYIGLGISPSGKMDNADLFIGGVRDEDSSIYSGDYHGVENSAVIDDQQDWNVTYSSQNATHTHMKVSRLLNTCDDQDYPITEETARVIWSYSTTDNVGYHLSTRGTLSLFLIAPPTPDIDLTQFQPWDIKVNMSMPGIDTSYWCTIHRGADVQRINHVVAFDALLSTPDAIKHTHHFIVYKCKAPENVDPVDFFEPHVGLPGQECYDDVDVIPRRSCQEYLFVWAVGSPITLFPEDVGYSIGKNPGKEYYMLEVHYDNPESSSNVTFETGVRIYHTTEIRDKEAALLVIGYPTDPTLIVPPNQTDFTVVGHCNTQCLNAIPETGINAFNVLLHAHISGRRLKLRHFRDGRELPWFAFDNNYDFDFQANKPIPSTKILSGDSLAYECTYDSTWNENEGRYKPVFGGLSTREEMCQAFLWHWPATTVEFCGSGYPWEKALITDFGIEYDENWLIKTPEYMAGLDYITALNDRFIWTDEFIRELERKRQFDGHQPFCKRHGQDEDLNITITYPDASNVYEPPNTCSRTTTNSPIITTTSASNKINFSLASSVILLLMSFMCK